MFLVNYDGKMQRVRPEKKQRSQKPEKKGKLETEHLTYLLLVFSLGVFFSCGGGGGERERELNERERVRSQFFFLDLEIDLEGNK